MARGIDGRAAGLAAFSLVLLCTGCPRIEHPYVLARGQSGAPGDSVVLLPVNTIAPLPFELQEDAAQVDEEIRRYLVDERGQRVSLLRGRQVRALWKQSVGEVEARDGPRGFAAAVGVLAARLREERDFDVVVIPSLAWRSAQLSGRTAFWDGVSRPLRIIHERNTVGRMTVSKTFAGHVDAVSLHVLAYSSEGRKLFESFGGLDLGRDAEMLDDRRWSLVTREGPLVDPEHLREGIAVAFDPYLPITAPESE